MMQIMLVETMDMEKLEKLYWKIRRVRHHNFISTACENEIKEEIKTFFQCDLDNFSLYHKEDVDRILREIRDLGIDN